jgi:hypothetical protein
MNRVGSTKVVATCFAACVITLSLVQYANASQSEFGNLYNYYFPNEGQDVRTGYRRYFDKLLFAMPPPSAETRRTTQVYHVLRGDDAAFRAFLHNPDGRWMVQKAKNVSMRPFFFCCA